MYGEVFSHYSVKNTHKRKIIEENFAYVLSFHIFLCHFVSEKGRVCVRISSLIPFSGKTLTLQFEDLQIEEFK